jgi:hypothetical protein
MSLLETYMPADTAPNLFNIRAGPIPTLKENQGRKTLGKSLYLAKYLSTMEELQVGKNYK